MKKIDLLNLQSPWLLLLISAVVVFMATYICDIQTLMEEATMLQADVKDAREQINLHANNLPDNNNALPAYSLHADITELLQFIGDKQIVLQNIDSTTYQLMMDMQDDRQLMELLIMLGKFGNKYLIENFNFSIKGGGFYAVLDLRISHSQENNKIQPSNDHSVGLPLCTSNRIKQLLPDQATHYALSDITVLGMLKNQNGIGVLIGFPNGITRILYKGDYLGREGGVITQLSENTINVKSIHRNIKLKIATSKER